MALRLRQGKRARHVPLAARVHRPRALPDAPQRPHGTLGQRQGERHGTLLGTGRLPLLAHRRRERTRCRLHSRRRLALQLPPLQALAHRRGRTGRVHGRFHLQHAQRQQSRAGTSRHRPRRICFRGIFLSREARRMARPPRSRRAARRTDVLACLRAVVLRTLFARTPRPQHLLHLSRQCALGAPDGNPGHTLGRLGTYVRLSCRRAAEPRERPQAPRLAQ